MFRSGLKENTHVRMPRVTIMNILCELKFFSPFDSVTRLASAMSRRDIILLVKMRDKLN